MPRGERRKIIRPMNFQAYNRDMHIGIDSRLPYYERGGISQYTIQLILALSTVDRSNQYTVFQSRKDIKSCTPPGATNFKPVRLWTPCHHSVERYALGIEIMPRRLDLFHSPDFIPPALGSKKRLITIHDLNFLWFPEFISADSHRYYSGQIHWAVHAADQISADSNHTRQDLIERLNVPPEKVTTIHLAANPIFTNSYAADSINETLAKYNLPAGFILFVGTISPRKNVKTVIRAYERIVHEKAIDIPLVLVGSQGYLYEELVGIVDELGLRDMVRHFTSVEDQELARFYSAAGVLVLPSYYEGFGLPPLEAMHCGCPVVVSNRASLPEVVGEAGIILDPEDIDGWAEAINRVLTDSTLRFELVQAGKNQARRFTWDKTAKATLRLYEKCMQ